MGRVEWGGEREGWSVGLLEDGVEGRGSVYWKMKWGGLSREGGVKNIECGFVGEWDGED